MTARFVCCALTIVISTSGLRAQQPPQPAPPPAPPIASLDGDAAGLMQGWALMAQKQPGLAESHAKNVLRRSPRNVAAIVLAIEAAIEANGPLAGLDHYEQWVGQRPFEEPALLRRVAIGFLKYEAAQQASMARYDALRILAGDSTTGVAGLLDPATEGPAGVRLRAAMGDERAVRTVMAELQSGAASKTASIDALAKSRLPLALPAIAAQLKDARPEIRAAAAEGLGQLGAPEGVRLLKPALSDESPFVQVKAAAALLKLNDTSGLAMLKGLLSADDAPSRLAGAQALADQPDAAWTEVVRGLARTGDPVIRLAAARLIAPTDPALAQSVADALALDANLAVRELATRIQAEFGGRDLPRLRVLLRNPDPLTRVTAAGGILTATR